MPTSAKIPLLVVDQTLWDIYRHYYLGNLWQGHVRVWYWESFTPRWPSLWTSNFGRSSAWRHCKPGFTRTYSAFTLLLPWLVPSFGGRRYSCWFASSSIMSCLLCCRLLTPLLVISLLHAFVHLRFGRVHTAANPMWAWSAHHVTIVALAKLLKLTHQVSNTEMGLGGSGLS